MTNLDDMERHNQLMRFMTDFRTSVETKVSNVEDSIKETNAKLEEKMRTMNEEVRKMNSKFDKHEEDERDVLERMDERLRLLEVEMKKSSLSKEKREEIRRKEGIEREETVEKETEKVVEEKSGRSSQQEVKDTRKKKFTRRVITEDDLGNEISSYRSSWAREMEEELAKAARAGAMNNGHEIGEGIVRDRCKNYEEKVRRETGPNNAGWMENEEERREEDVPESWERLIEPEKFEKTKQKIRKPIVIKNWFADETSEEDTSSGSEDDAQWQEVDREKKRKRRQQMRKEKLKKRMAEVAGKARMMIGIGKITKRTLTTLEEELGCRKKAEKKAVENFLQESLDF